MIQKLFKQSLLSFAGLMLVSNMASASDGSIFIPKNQAEEYTYDSPVKLHPYVALNVGRISNFNSMGYGLTAGSDVVWLFSENVGAFAGLDYAQIKAEDSGAKASVDYLDIPFGVSFNMSQHSLSLGNAMANTASVFNVGLYYGIPVSKFKVAGASTTANGILGLGLTSHTDFKITQNFWLGFFAQVKYGFFDIVDHDKIGESSKPFTFAVGLSSRFL